jgi:hypothetical protein
VTRVEHLLEVVLASLAELHLRVAEIEVDIAARPLVLQTTMGPPDFVELDDGAMPDGAVSPIHLHLVVDNGDTPDGP